MYLYELTPLELVRAFHSLHDKADPTRVPDLCAVVDAAMTATMTVKFGRSEVWLRPDSNLGPPDGIKVELRVGFNYVSDPRELVKHITDLQRANLWMDYALETLSRPVKHLGSTIYQLKQLNVNWEASRNRSWAIDNWAKGA